MVCQELRRRGHNVSVYTRVENHCTLSSNSAIACLKGIQSYDRHFFTNADSFDIFHALNAAWCWVANLGVPTFVSAHGNDFLSPNPVFGFDLKYNFRLPRGDRLDYAMARMRTRRMMRSTLPRCKKIFCNSQFTRRAFLRNYPSCDQICDVAGVGVDERFFRNEVRKRTSDTPELLTVCRLDEPRKNVDRILIALASLGNYSFRYTIVGDGVLRAELAQLAASLGLEQKVRFMGGINDEHLEDVYAQSDLFLLISSATKNTVEGFGIVYLEANAMGVPTLAARIGGAQEAVHDGESGFFTRDDSVEAVSDALREFFDGRVSFSADKCRTFAQQFTWKRVVDIIEDGYHNSL